MRRINTARVAAAAIVQRKMPGHHSVQRTRQLTRAMSNSAQEGEGLQSGRRHPAVIPPARLHACVHRG